MDALVQSELSKLDPNVPFRASTTHRHHTWARTFHSRPELYIRPQSNLEIQKVVTLARRCRRRIVLVGCGHSPSDLTCTSSWMVNLDQYNTIRSVDAEQRTVVMEAGIRLYDLGRQLRQYGLAMPNIGSIDNQAIAGAIATGTHGSSTRHGLLSQSVLGLKIMLANGRTVSCSAKQNKDLFRAALLSLGALGIITEVTYQAVPAFDIEWYQSLHPLDELLESWPDNLWTKAEYTRVWWMPYMKKAIVWRADQTTKPRRPPKQTWYGGLLGYHAYHLLLYLAQWMPSLLPSIEKFVIGVQYSFTPGSINSAVEEGHKGLLMNCLYSQFVNEWAVPLSAGPEAISRLSAWLNGAPSSTSRIPFDNKKLYIHAPIEVRVADTSTTTPRPYLDNTVPDGPTLYLNATLYRPYNRDPPCRQRYYEAFEWLMKDLGGRPHWAKNFQNVSREEFWDMYPDMGEWVRIRNEVDPEGMFVGEWHRRNLLPLPTTHDDNDEHQPHGAGIEKEPGAEVGLLPLEEHETSRSPAKGGGVEWKGAQSRGGKATSPLGSEESFDLLQGVEAEASVVFEQEEQKEDEEEL